MITPTNLPSLLLGLCLLAPGLRAFAPHPTVLRVKHGNEILAVVRVHGDDPYVMLDGKETLIRSTPVYFLENADGFSDNFVEAAHGALSGRLKLKVLGDYYFDRGAGGISGAITMEVSMKAEKTIKGGFITMAMINNIFMGDIIVHELPELPAGQWVKVKLEVHALPRTDNPVFFAQIFDEAGREVRTPDMQIAWKYYTQRDRLRLAQAVAAYQKKYANTDHDAVPAFMPKPIFKPGAVLPKGTITVVLTVEPDGTVSHVDAGMVADDSVRDSLTDALGGWLFLPKLKAGQPVSNYIQVPLQF